MSRLDLKEKLENVLDKFKVKLYFQPPANIKMTYPCLVYKVSKAEVIYAGNNPYVEHIEYQLMLITKKPDEMITSNLLRNIPFIRFDRAYISNNLYHYVFTCYEQMIQEVTA